MNPKPLPPALLALSPGDLVSEGVRAYLAGVGAALGAGLTGILLREARLGDGAFLELARGLRELLRDVGGWLGIHDRAHLVAACDAQGLHLGFRSLSVSESRSLVGDRVTIGRSTHAGDEPISWQGADYRFFGPVFETPSKTGILAPVGTSELGRAVSADPVPVWGLGGIRPDNVDQLSGTGVRGAAVLSGVFGAQDVALATKAYLQSWLSGGGL